LVVVCFPAKKKVLHSSSMSCTGIAFATGARIVVLSPALIMSPSKSRKLPESAFSPSVSTAAASSLRRPMSLVRLRRISLSSFHDSQFFFVGMNLRART
jgi:hypothetical protein